MARDRFLRRSHIGANNHPPAPPVVSACQKTFGELEKAEPFRISNHIKQRVRWGKTTFCGRKSHFPSKNWREDTRQGAYIPVHQLVKTFFDKLKHCWQAMADVHVFAGSWSWNCFPAGGRHSGKCKKEILMLLSKHEDLIGTSMGIRTPVFAVRGRRLRPLDHGGMWLAN